MTADGTVRQQARRFVRDHGKDAPVLAAMRGQALLYQGDLDGSARWVRIGKRAIVLLSKAAHAAAVDPMSGDSVESFVPVNQIPTLSDLPSPNIKRWHFQHKATVVTAVRTGLIDLAEACARYSITIGEFLSWKRLLDEHGLRGLRVTRLHEYRLASSRGSGEPTGQPAGAQRHRRGQGPQLESAGVNQDDVDRILDGDFGKAMAPEEADRA